MKRYVIMREANSMLELESIINGIYQEAEKKGFGYKVINFTQSSEKVSTNRYGGYGSIHLRYTVLIEISTEGSNQ